MLRIPDGRRCWTLDYAETANYHMDILPSIIGEGYFLLEKSMSASDASYDEIAIRITDKLRPDYIYETNPDLWLQCNPFGYAKWFFQRATLSLTKAFSLNEAVRPVPAYQKEKLPLQRVVQILKRHRDMMFNGDEHKPISIIITTLAARAYQKETDIIGALVSVASNMVHGIEERWDAAKGKPMKWIANPVNDQENFADKWVEKPQKEANFYRWIKQLQQDLNKLTMDAGGLHIIQENLQRALGRRDVERAFANYGDSLRTKREAGKAFVNTVSGALATGGTAIKNHNFFGSDEK